MNGQSIVFGLTPNELRPGPDFSAGHDETGKWTGSQTFTCRKFDFSGSTIQAKLVRGTSATVIYPELSNEWDFLTVQNARHEHQPGGMTKVFVEYGGIAAESFEFGDEKTEVSYSTNGNLTEKDMLSHPKFLTDASQFEIDALASLKAGTGRVNPNPARAGTIEIIDNYTGIASQPLMTDIALKWYRLIFKEQRPTYQVSAIEWTKTSNTKEGISGEDLSSLGYIATPDGHPPSFTKRNWLFNGASENRTKSGAKTVKTWSKTWQLSPQGEEWDTDIYTKPA
jgi:hypothetical protein